MVLRPQLQQTYRGGQVELPWFRGQVDRSHAMTTRLSTDDEPQQLQRDLAYWIEGSDNRERRYSTIGYLRPIDDEQRFIAAPTLTPVNS
jgi:hypothetical protein